MTRPTLTTKTAAAARPAAARYELRDKKVSGLRLIVQTSGVRTWAVRYMADGGRARRYTIGSYSEALGLDEARKMAATVKLGVVKGGDPAAQKQSARRDGNTVAAVWHRYNKIHLGDPDELEPGEKPVKAEVGEATAAATRSFFVRRILPGWGHLAMTAIKRRDVMTVLDTLAGTKDAKRKAKTRLSHFFQWAMDREIIESSPVAGIKVDTAPSRSRVLSDDELRRVWKAADAAGYPFGPMVKALILTMARRTEVAAMTWDEVNGQAGLWTIPESRTKNGIALDVHRTASLDAIIAAAPRVSDFVFSTRENRPVSGFAKMKARLDALTGDEVKPWTLHDLRRTGATIMQRLSVRKEVIDAAQNHKMAGISGTYLRHGYAAEKVAAFEALAAEVDRIVTGRAVPSNVVQLTNR